MSCVSSLDLSGIYWDGIVLYALDCTVRNAMGSWSELYNYATQKATSNAVAATHEVAQVAGHLSNVVTEVKSQLVHEATQAMGQPIQNLTDTIDRSSQNLNTTANHAFMYLAGGAVGAWLLYNQMNLEDSIKRIGRGRKRPRYVD